jgi:hypothetical protein
MLSFTTLEELAAYWKHPESHISSLLNFFDCQGIKKHVLEGDTVCSNTISLFHGDIQPLWEDPRNSQGGDYSTFVRHPEKQWDELYSFIIFSLIGNTPDLSNVSTVLCRCWV